MRTPTQLPFGGTSLEVIDWPLLVGGGAETTQSSLLHPVKIFELWKKPSTQKCVCVCVGFFETGPHLARLASVSLCSQG